MQRPMMGQHNGNRNDNANAEDSKYANEVILVRRVAKVTGGKKRLRFSVVVAVGDREGQVGVALAKGADAQSAIAKGIEKAKKNFIHVPVTKDVKTIPHLVHAKFKAAEVLIKPGVKGSGVVAGGATRKVLELAGVENVVAKCLGSSNAIANALCTIRALSKFLPKNNA